MREETHVRARQLLRTAQVEGIPAGERQWLDTHIADCAACSNDARALAAAIDSLRMFGVNTPLDVVRRTRLAVHERAEQRRLQRESMVFVWLAAATATLWAVLVTPYAWTAFTRVGDLLHVPVMAWLPGFLVWWFLPATVLGAAAAWRRTAKERGSDGVTEENWRQR